MCFADHLREQVQKYQRTTGETTMVVVVEKRDESMGVHHVGFDPHIGLTVDGKPPSPKWYQEAEAFHPLQWPPAVLH